MSERVQQTIIYYMPNRDEVLMMLEKKEINKVDTPEFREAVVERVKELMNKDCCVVDRVAQERDTPIGLAKYVFLKLECDGAILYAPVIAFVYNKNYLGFETIVYRAYESAHHAHHEWKRTQQSDHLTSSPP